MATDSTATYLVTALLGGGAATTVGVLVRARVDARKAGPEVESIIVGGAEKAVATMGLALQAAERRIDALERERERMMTMIASQQATIDALAVELAALRAG